MNLYPKWITAVAVTMAVTLAPKTADADFWGGDDVILAQILAQTIQELSTLHSILGTGADTFQYMQSINDGLRDALNLMRTRNTTLSPGIFSELQNLDQAMSAVQGLYGAVPGTPEARMQAAHDQTVAEAIQMHNDVFKYTDSVDGEGERIKDYARVVSPGGAARLSAESLGVLIHLMNQLLRTNAEILKLQGEQLALGNRHQKIESEHFKMQYEGLSQAFSQLQPEYDLPSLK